MFNKNLFSPIYWKQPHISINSTFENRYSVFQHYKHQIFEKYVTTISNLWSNIPNSISHNGDILCF